MKINKLTASFGKLQNETLRFHEGLNIIYAPNESGKSTWCAFIRAMLYGVDSAERSRAGYLPDKLKYVPWSGAPMEGTMEVTADSCDITLTRSTRSKGAPMKEFSATYTGSNVPVENMNGTNAGELLTGVTKDVFRRSAFIEQGNVGVKGSPELEKRIAAIVSTGEEQTSYTEADERLRAWQRKRRWNRRGLLPDLEGQMDDTKHMLDEMEGSVDRLEALEQELRQGRQEAQQMEQQVVEARKRQRREALTRLNQGRSELQESSQAHDRAMEELSLRREELRQSSFADRTLPQLEQEAEADLDRLEELGDPRVSGRKLLPALLCFALAIACAAVYSFLDKLPLIIAAGVFCLAAVVLLMAYSRSRQNAQRCQDERKRILKKYRVQNPSEIGRVVDRFRDLYEAVRDADREIQTRFSPELGRVAARYMSAVTGGRYEDVLINRDFSARTRTKGDAVARDAEYLSAGTLDLMYLAVRLAVCELALPDGEPCPLILDDALVNLDETRFKQAIELLRQISKERQVILFTCRQQEGQE